MNNTSGILTAQGQQQNLALQAQNLNVQQMQLQQQIQGSVQQHAAVAAAAQLQTCFFVRESNASLTFLNDLLKISKSLPKHVFQINNNSNKLLNS